MASLFSPLFAVYNRAVTAKDRNFGGNEVLLERYRKRTHQAAEFMGLPPDAQEYDIGGRRMEGPGYKRRLCKNRSRCRRSKAQYKLRLRRDLAEAEFVRGQ